MNRWQRPMFGPFSRKQHTGVPADHLPKHPGHVHRLVHPGLPREVVRPPTANNLLGWLLARMCVRRGGHFEHYDADADDFFCCACGHTRPWRPLTLTPYGDNLVSLVGSGPAVMAALPVHHTDTSDATWDGGANETNLSNDDGEAEYKQAFAWQDPDADPDTKAAYGFIHHFVDGDGKVGDASTRACSSTVAILNGGRGVDVKNQPWYADRDGIYKHVAAHLSDSGVKDDDLPELDDMAVVEARWSAHVASTDEMGALHPAFTGHHQHAHSAYGDQGGDKTHEHMHFHNNDSKHGHTHGAAAIIEPPALADRKPFDGMGETARREADADHEVVDPDRLAAMVASALERFGDRALTAATDASGNVVGAPFHAYLCVEGIRTDDGRELCVGSMRYPDLPISLRLLVEDEGGHWGAVSCGRIDSIEPQVKDGYTYHYAEGEFGSDPNGQLAELLVAEQTQRFVSVDLRDMTGQWIEQEIIVTPAGGMYDVIVEEGGSYDCWFQVTDAVIGAATVLSIPALPQAVITLADVPLPDSPIAVEAAPAGLNQQVMLVASAAPTTPPAAWFQNPGFHVGDERLVRQPPQRGDTRAHYACPLTVTDDGQVYGHAAWWGAQHTGFLGKRVNPPHSPTGYARYLTGAVTCDDGTVVDVGQITMGTGHADLSKRIDGRERPLSYGEVKAHYDGGYGAVQVADVTVGEDDFGIWIAGAMRAGLTDDQVREFKALGLSCDWRDLGQGLDTIAILSVPSPGFPVARRASALVAAGAPQADVLNLSTRAGMSGGKVVALVAAGRVHQPTMEERLAALEHSAEANRQVLADVQDLLRPMKVEQMRARMGLT